MHPSRPELILIGYFFVFSISHFAFSPHQFRAITRQLARADTCTSAHLRKDVGRPESNSRDSDLFVVISQHCEHSPDMLSKLFHVSEAVRPSLVLSWNTSSEDCHGRGLSIESLLKFRGNDEG